MSGNTIYASGEQPADHIAAIDAGSSAATTWATDADGPVLALAVKGNTVYAGGSFSHIGGQARNNIAALGAGSGAVGTWDANASNSVDIITVSGGTVYAGGEFRSIAGQPQSTLAAISADPPHGRAPVSEMTNATEAHDALTCGPNPTRAGMEIHYAVAREGHVRLELLDVSGRVVETLADRSQAPGRYSASWNGAGLRGRLSPGLYFVRLTTPDQVTVRRFAMLP